MSDYPYIQMPKNCQTTDAKGWKACIQRGWQDFDCYSQIKEQYVSILQNGFADNGAYHPALKCGPQPFQTFPRSRCPGR